MLLSLTTALTAYHHRLCILDCKAETVSANIPTSLREMLKTSRMSLSHCLLGLPLPFSHLSFPSRWSFSGPPFYLSFNHFVFILRLYKQLCLRHRILRMYHAQSKLSWQLIFLMNSLNFWRRLSLKILSSVTTGREPLLKLLERLRVMNRKENEQLKTVQNNSYG